MREPRFWSRDVDPRSREAAPLLRFLLTPLSWIYASVTRNKIKRTDPLKVRPTIICVGNLTAGGVGKSPVVAALRDKISEEYGLRVATLSRGYKGKLKGPLRVDPEMHSASDVGDEPLMFSMTGETWIGADRAATGQAMSNDGVDVVLMDDGHQNPGLHKDFTFIAVDAKAGFGNGFVIPKGPLREPVKEGLERADALILMGYGTPPDEISTSKLPKIHGSLHPQNTPPRGAYVAFAGIGRPEKFFDTLNLLEMDVRDAVPFSDHHEYSEADLRYLRRLAADHSAQLITTEKDLARLGGDQREGILSLPVYVQFDPQETLDKLLSDVIKNSAHG